MAKRRKKARKSSRRRRSAKSCAPACPIIRISCRAGAPGKPKSCTVRTSGKARKMNSDAAGKYVGKLVRAQKKRRCAPVVRGGAGWSK